jgi:hypothetical protein
MALSSLFLFTALAISLPTVIQAQANCSIPDITPQIIAEFPAQLQIPKILPGDSAATNLYAQLVATNAPALNIRPKGSPDGTGDFTATV